jgi:hypothetical protein
MAGFGRPPVASNPSWLLEAALLLAVLLLAGYTQPRQCDEFSAEEMLILKYKVYFF